jgi:hypothetical protein
MAATAAAGKGVRVITRKVVLLETERSDHPTLYTIRCKSTVLMDDSEIGGVSGAAMRVRLALCELAAWKALPWWVKVWRSITEWGPVR